MSPNFPFFVADGLLSELTNLIESYRLATSLFSSSPILL